MAKGWGFEFLLGDKGQLCTSVVVVVTYKTEGFQQIVQASVCLLLYLGLGSRCWDLLCAFCVSF